MLGRIFRDAEGAVELRALPNVRGEGRTPCIYTRDAEEVAEFLKQWDRPEYGVFFGVCTRKPDSTPPGRLGSLLMCSALWVDLDGAKPLEILKGCYCPPSIIVDSGGGLHAYWLLDEPEDVSDATSNDHPLVHTLRELRRVFAGDPAVCDLARVMRLPGSHNSKHGDVRPVHVVHDSGKRYSLADLRDWLASQRELIGEPVDPFLAAAEKLGAKPALDVEEALATMAPGNIHERQLRISASLVTAGKGEDEIVEVLLGATRLAAGQEGRSWNWKKEEDGLRQMIRSAGKKFQVVELSERRRQRVNGGEEGGAEQREAKMKGALIEKVAKLALEAWGRPVAIIRGELWTYGGGVWEPLDGERKRYFQSHVHQAARTLKAVEEKALNGAWRWIYEDLNLWRQNVEWDRAGVIVGNNGALEIETGLLLPHSPDHYATRKVPCDIDPEAACPRFTAFLEDSLPKDCIGTVQEWMGASLVRGKPREMSKGLIVHGPSYTGKTQLANIVRALLGGAACGLSVRAMGERFGLQPLLYASGWIADDAVGRHEVMDAENYKKVVTGESMSVERKNKESLEVEFDLPVLLTMNNFPVVKDNSDAVYNRTLVLPMTNVRTEEDAIPVAKSVIASELPGVLNFAVEGWRKLKERGRFEPPEVMLVSLREFKNDNNPFQDFAKECLLKNPDRMVDRTMLRDIFNGWLKKEMQLPRGWGPVAISGALKGACPWVKGEERHGMRTWVGIAFTEAARSYLEVEHGQERPSLVKMNMGLTAEVRGRQRPDGKPVF
jgi:P4 family phage/plasmid primase-like protien